MTAVREGCRNCCRKQHFFEDPCQESWLSMVDYLYGPWKARFSMLKRDSIFKGSQQAERELAAQTKTTFKFRKSWYKMAMQDTQEWEASRSRVSSKKGPYHTTRIDSMSHGVVVVVDQGWKCISRHNHFQMCCETTSLAKRECWNLVALGGILTCPWCWLCERKTLIEVIVWVYELSDGVLYP